MVEDYGVNAPHTFSGKINKVTIDIKKMEKAGPVEIEKLKQTMQRRALAE